MAVQIQTFAIGDTNYIDKHNANYQNIKVAVEALQNAISGTASNPEDSLPLAYKALFGPANSIIGEGSYLPSQSSAHNLSTAAGYAFVVSGPVVANQASPVILDFAGQTTGTFYIHVDTSGTPSFNQTASGALYSVYYDSGTGDFSSIAREGNLAWGYVDWEGAQTNLWGMEYDDFGARLTGIESSAYGVLTKNAVASNITLTDLEALEQSIIRITDGPQTADIELIVPDEIKVYQILNAASSSYGVTVKTSGGTGYEVIGDHYAILYCDATDTIALFDLDRSTGGGAPPDEFIDHSDTPNSYTGYGWRNLRVNLTGDGLEYYVPAFKQPVVVATTEDITLSGEQSIDGIGIVTGDRVLVKDQTATEENGIYVADSSSWTRAKDADLWASLVGAVVVIEKGTVYGDGIWLCTVNSGGTLETTAVTWDERAADNVSGPGSSTDGNLVSWNGTTGEVLADSGYAATDFLQDITGEDFVDLSDTPADYSGAAEYTVKVNSGGDGLEFVDVSGTSYDFIGLNDTPANYTSSGGYFVKVNDTPDGLEFVADPGYLTDITGEDFTDLNDTPSDYTGGVGGHAVKVNSGATALEFVDDPYFVSGFFPGSPGASAVMLVHVFGVAVDFPSGLTGSQGTGEAAATAQTDIDIQKNGSSVGTMRFAASGSTATFIMASATSYAIGDKMQLIAPATPDSTLADIAYTLKGTR